MTPASDTPRSDAPRPLSPISRRVFLRALPPAGAAFLAACGGGGDDYADCIYCDEVGQDYEECESDYCDYFDYGDGA